MKSIYPAFGLFLLLVVSTVSMATGNPEWSRDPAEVRLLDKPFQYDLQYQHMLHGSTVWVQFVEQFGAWGVHFNEWNAKPHRAWGDPIAVPGSNATEQALYFIEHNLQGFNLPSVAELVARPVQKTQKFEWVRFGQSYQGLEVLGSDLLVKLRNGAVVMFGADVYEVGNLSTQPAINESQAIEMAMSGLTGSIISAGAQGLKILPLPRYRHAECRLVYEVWVKTRDEFNVPSHYLVYVDAQDGKILYRKNKVSHICKEPVCRHTGDPQPRTMGLPLTVSAHVKGGVHLNSPYDPVTQVSLPNLRVTIQGTDYYTDANGQMTAPVAGPVQGQFRLMGLWSTIMTNDQTPGFGTALQEGSNEVSFTNQNSNVKERSAYYNVNRIHDHMKAWMPGFTGLDISLTTNIDVTGTCNAFYDGSSINFFDIGGGCNATSLISDVVFHEYGHGINDKYYQSIGGNFANGAMGEGYADYWAISLSNNPVIGSGFYTDSEDGIRRYDMDPKVYPIDLVGEVHADGEIICGAWYDTHLLMGANWDNTMALFIETYAGLQAQTWDGNEGVAFTDVLLDALQADDDDALLSNGTPNSAAIIEGFKIHGITLLSSATMTHNNILFAEEEMPVTIYANVVISFPFDQFLGAVKLFYRINNESTWSNVNMTYNGGPSYSAVIPPQPKSTVIAYYIGLEDINGTISNVLPVAANQNPYPNLPYYTIVGVDIIGQHDCDNHEDWGAWNMGMPGDNNTTGTWTFAIPIGSFGTPGDYSTVVQTYYQHTPGGEYCFVTGNAATEADGIGTNDVDGGHTTLQTKPINMSGLTEPVVAYWRWYTNSPPSGANPGADWWQVRISNNGGQTWTYIENTMTSDISWRRHAFRVKDYLTPTSNMLMQFIASDSTHIGQNLDGGSLIEAAIDDFVLYDEAEGVGVKEPLQNFSFDVYPNPAVNLVNIEWQMLTAERITLNVYNSIGERIQTMDFTTQSAGRQRKTLDTSSWAEGLYTIVVVKPNERLTRPLVVQHE